MELNIEKKYIKLLQLIAYLLIIGNLGMVSISYSQHFSNQSISFVNHDSNMDHHCIYEDIEKEIEDQLPIPSQNTGIDSLEKTISLHPFTLCLQSIHNDISTPPPEFLS